MPRSLPLLLAWVVVLSVVGYRPCLAQTELILGGGSATSDGLSLSSGNVVVREHQPGVAFATVTAPSQKKRVAYFIVFSHDRADVKSASTNNGVEATTFHTIDSFGKKCSVHYRITLKDPMRSVETLAVGTRDFEVSKGRVFLIDLRPDEPKVTQVAAEEFGTLPERTDVETTEKFARSALKALRQTNEDIDRFSKTLESGQK